MTPAVRTPPGTARALAVLLAVLLAGCATSLPPAAPASVPPVTGTPPSLATGAPPDAPVTAPGDPGAPPAGGVPEPQPTMVTPVQGLSDSRPIAASAIEAQASGRDIIVRLSWWSGPAPCSVLAGVDTARDGTTITLTIREGAAQQGVACPEIAILQATAVDLGAPGPGTWTIAAYGRAPAVQVTVTG